MSVRRVRVRLFGPARDAVGSERVELDVPEPATAGAAIEALAGRWPGLAELLPRSRVAVNLAYVPADTPLAEGDEVAVLPPVGGG